MLILKISRRETEEPAVVENEAVVAAEKPAGEEVADAGKENPEKEAEEVEPEEKVGYFIHIYYFRWL